MTLEQTPYTATRTEEERAEDKSKVVRIRFSREELRAIENDARLLRQEKLGTAIKQMILLGRTVLHSPFSRAYAEVVFNNERKNERLGIGEADPRFSQM